MNQQIIYVRATEDWSHGVFAKHFKDGWHYVYWDYTNVDLEPTFTESCKISETWAANILKDNPMYPVYQEYTYDGNPT